MRCDALQLLGLHASTRLACKCVDDIVAEGSAYSQVLDVLIALLKPRQGNERLNGQESAHLSEASMQLDISIKQAAVQVKLCA